MLILNCEEPVLLFYAEVLVSFLLSSSYTHMDFFKVFMCVINLYIFTVVIIRCMYSLEVRALLTVVGLLLLFETGFHFPLTLLGEITYQLVKGLGYRLDDSSAVVQFPASVRLFLFASTSRRALGPAQPTAQWLPQVLSLWLRQLRHAADHSPPASPEVV